MPGSQGDPGGTQGNPDVGFRGENQACPVSLSCVPWPSPGPRDGLVSSEQFQHTCPTQRHWLGWRWHGLGLRLLPAEGPGFPAWLCHFLVA